jgi:hypothetical protein
MTGKRSTDATPESKGKSSPATRAIIASNLDELDLWDKQPLERRERIKRKADGQARLTTTEEALELPQTLQLTTSGSKLMKVQTCFGAVYVNDPGVEIDDFDPRSEYFVVNPPRIEAAGLLRMLHIAHHCHEYGGNEVSFNLIHQPGSPVMRVLLPRQQVSPIHCDVDLKVPCLDLSSHLQDDLLEVVPYPPDGWSPAGTIHSHHTMPPFPSSTDDDNELGQNGLHGILGNFMPTNRTVARVSTPEISQELRFTLTANHRRYSVDADLFMPDIQVRFLDGKGCVKLLSNLFGLNYNVINQALGFITKSPRMYGMGIGYERPSAPVLTPPAASRPVGVEEPEQDFDVYDRLSYGLSLCDELTDGRDVLHPSVVAAAELLQELLLELMNTPGLDR